ncbi:MAG TPA: SH3 domain-containing protein [Bryobacteraceae bacterium]
MISSRAAICVLPVLLVSCATRPPEAPSVGEAYVGPSTLNLRRDLSAKSPIAGTAKHGEKLEILEYQHRLVRVRSPQGVEGWTDLRQLLTPDQMTNLRRMADSAAQYPSQGVATVFELLNMHSEPNRVSPSFWQIPENGKVDVLAHKLAPRTQPAAPAPQLIVKKTTPLRKKSKEREPARVGPPPMPPAPKPPADWVALSVPKSDSLQAENKPEPKPAAPVPMDDWSLVRTADHHAGWVLTRMLSMAIPDEVAQYAEGHRITSYFPLGQVEDQDQKKTNWLWTTITKGLEPYEFDSFRVFVWSRKHHRYETAYIERKVTGHFPVEVNNTGEAPSFSLVLEDDDGKLLRKTYSFEGFRVHMVHKEPYTASAAGEMPKPAPGLTPQASPKASRSLFARVKDRVARLFRK